MISNPINIERCCAYADLVVGAVLVPGERPPIVVTREMVRHDETALGDHGYQHR